MFLQEGHQHVPVLKTRQISHSAHNHDLGRFRMKSQCRFDGLEKGGNFGHAGDVLDTRDHGRTEIVDAAEDDGGI